jgi:hypothetical protein
MVKFVDTSIFYVKIIDKANNVVQKRKVDGKRHWLLYKTDILRGVKHTHMPTREPYVVCYL